MRTSEAFLLGTITGAVVIWLWGREIQASVREKSVRCARRQRRVSGRWRRRLERCWTEAGTPCVEPKSSCRIPRSTSATLFEQGRLRFAQHQQPEKRNQGVSRERR